LCPGLGQCCHDSWGAVIVDLGDNDRDCRAVVGSDELLAASDSQLYDIAATENRRRGGHLIPAAVRHDAPDGAVEGCNNANIVDGHAAFKFQLFARVEANIALLRL
jgi:hypothetical protein